MASQLALAAGAGVNTGYLVAVCPAIAIGIEAGFPGCSVKWLSAAGCWWGWIVSDLTGEDGVSGECLFELFGECLDCCGELLVGISEDRDTVAIGGCRKR